MPRTHQVKLLLYITAVLVIFSAKVVAQDVRTTEQKVEDLAEELEADIEDDSYLQNLDYYARHPLPVNTASKEELENLKFLTGLQIDGLLQYRRVLGTLINSYELQAVPYWDIATIKRILPYITIGQNAFNMPSLISRFKGGDHTVLFRETKGLQKAKGYNHALRTHYLGSNDHLLIRYKYQYQNNLQYGFTAEKDAGEPLFKKPNATGFDFYSAHFFARNVGSIKALAIGDFTVNMGQGLIQWQSLAFNKSADAMAIKRQSPILMPYSSPGEILFHRGAGITIKKGSIEATGFASFKNISTNIVVDTLTHEKWFTSFQTSGLHRTPSEIADKSSTRQLTIGGNVTYQLRTLKIGFNSVSYQFSNPLQKRADPYNLYAITGKQWVNSSIDYSFTYKNVHLFGEAAIDKNYHMAILNGALVSVASNIDLSFLYRDISKAYQSLYANAFTENVAPTNEKGLYTGISVRPFLHWRLDGYLDYYYFPWLKYRVDAPSYGQSDLVQLTYQPNKQLEVYIRYKKDNKSYNEPDTMPLHHISPKPREGWRVNLSYAMNRKLVLHSRVETVWYNKTGKDAENGFLTYIEAALQFKSKLAGNFRLQYFTTDGYNSRIYAFENDVLYSYSVPASFDTGVRYYINANYDFTKKLTIWLRWVQTIYNPDKNSIGSGLDVIQGNKRSEIKFQLRYKVN